MRKEAVVVLVVVLVVFLVVVVVVVFVLVGFWLDLVRKGYVDISCCLSGTAKRRSFDSYTTQTYCVLYGQTEV